jgi:TolB protein
MPASASATDVPGRILFVRDTGIWIWRGGDVDAVLKDDGLSDARWSPDGTQIIYVRSGNSFSDLYILNLATQSTYPVTYNQSIYQEGSPDYVASSTWAMDPDWSAAGIIGFMSDYASPDGTFQLWLMDDSFAAYLAPAAQFEDNIDSLSLSGDASLAAYVMQERQLDGTSRNRVFLRDLLDGIAYPLAEARDAFDPAIAPDQTTVAVSIRSDDGQESDLFLVDRATGAVTRLTRGLQASNPTWSPDGQWIAFIRMIDFGFEAWALPMEGTIPGEPFKIFKADGFDAPSGLSWTYA